MKTRSSLASVALAGLMLLPLGLAACGDDPAPGTTEPDTAVADPGPGGGDAKGTDEGQADTYEPPPPPEDTDGDGLSDPVEAEMGTDPTLEDTDGDRFWDGWEAAAGSDPLDPLSIPELAIPSGAPYLLDLVDIPEPALLATFLEQILTRWPPIIAFMEGLTDGADDPLTLLAALGERSSLGDDDAPGTEDDSYALTLPSLDAKTGEFQFAMAGAIKALAIDAAADQIAIDLTGISEVVAGVRFRVDSVKLTGTLDAPLETIADVVLEGELSRAGIEEILADVELPIPIDVDELIELLDEDGDGIVVAKIVMRGSRTNVSGWITKEPPEPQPREPGECCPLADPIGEPIDAHMAVVDQGIQADEEAAAATIVSHALANPEHLDFLATMRVVDGQRRYYVYSTRGHVYFTRDRTTDADGAWTTTYEVFSLADPTDLDGTPIAQDDAANPLRASDPYQMATVEEFEALAEPIALTDKYAALGYAADDARLARIPRTETSYPFAYERISQIFDDPRCGDFVLQKPSYTKGGANPGNHGHLNSLQSRSPLVIAGPGVKTAATVTPDATWTAECDGCGPDGAALLLYEEVAKGVDIAPTVAAALGVQTTLGVGPHGRFTDDVYLKWQDGVVHSAVFAEDPTAAATPPAEYALIIINDGLTSAELLNMTLDPTYAEMDAYRELMSRGVTFRYGSITNFASNTYPGHNMVGAGVYSGHHGLVDNHFFERDLATVLHPITNLRNTSVLIGGAHPKMPVETLHEAVTRSFGGAWDKAANPTGAMTVSINDPSARGAVFATLEEEAQPEGWIIPDPTDVETVNGQSYELPKAELTDAYGALDNASVSNLRAAYLDNPAKGTPIPKYAILNLSSSDGAGHKTGPHSDRIRTEVLPRLNVRMRIVLEVLKEAGIYDQTLIVLTSDHGMELLDPNVSGSPLSGLTKEIGLTTASHFVYIRQLTLAAPAELAVGANEVTFTVADRDGGEPVGEATVTVTAGETVLAEGATATDGTVTLTFEVPAAGDVSVAARQGGYTTETAILEAK